MGLAFCDMHAYWLIQSGKKGRKIMLMSSELILLTFKTPPPFFRLFVTKTNRHITARIEHIKGNIVVQASTKEWAIKKHLYSTSDVSASENLGRVLADRCLESGINFVHNSMKKTDKEQEGVCLSHHLILWHNYVLTCALPVLIYFLACSVLCLLFYQSYFFVFIMKKMLLFIQNDNVLFPILKISKISIL